MGYNSTIVIFNDALSSIQNDAHFGSKLYKAVLNLNTSKPIRIGAGGCCTAALAVETHHADLLLPVVVGGNWAYPVEKAAINCNIMHKKDHDLGLEMLKELANRYGYYLRKKKV